jgi:hypothetical protein
MKERKLDIFNVISHIRKHDVEFYQRLTDEQKKEFQPFVAMRWLAGSNHPGEVYFLNEMVNPYIFTLGNDHKHLLMSLMSVSMFDKSSQAKYLKQKTTPSGTAVTDVIKKYHDYSTREARQAVDIFSKDDILSMALHLGYDKAELAKLKRSLK